MKMSEATVWAKRRGQAAGTARVSGSMTEWTGKLMASPTGQDEKTTKYLYLQAN